MPPEPIETVVARIDGRLGAIEGKVDSGFLDTNRRIDHLITRSEFTAEVRRIDGVAEQNAKAIQDTQAALDRHLDQTTEIVEATRAADAQVAANAKAEVEAIREDFGKRLAGIATLTRWAVGLAATLLVSAAIAVANYLIP